MIRRLAVRWPDPRPFLDRDGRPVRILAVSDERDAAVDDARNRDALGRIDLVLGCGDLSPDYLDFLASCLNAPLSYVRGNHDRKPPWPQPPQLPAETAGAHVVNGVRLLALPWPGSDRGPVRRLEVDAWSQVLRLAADPLMRPRPCLVMSHVPPRGVGDGNATGFHRGFDAYRLLLDRTRPPLWVHGHTNLAGVHDWRNDHDGSIVANATGGILVELVPADDRAEQGDPAPS